MTESFIHQLDDFLYQQLKVGSSQVPERARSLYEVMEYSLFNGGKRFRPLVGLRVAEALGCSTERVLPFLAALEMAHTFSLIHDDLPCMDNDDFRRGQPTSHRKFSEGLALLAGDALLTEAFTILGECYEDVPEVGLELTKLLSEAVGARGMIAGQAIDISFFSQKNSQLKESKVLLAEKELIEFYKLKTGALIRVAVEGVTAVARTSQETRRELREYSQYLGLAFQLVDDLIDLDSQQSNPVQLKNLLEKSTFLACEKINNIVKENPRARVLCELAEWNLRRKR